MAQITIPELKRILKQVPRSSVEPKPRIYGIIGSSNTYIKCGTPNYANRVVQALRSQGISCNLNSQDWKEVIIL